MSHNLCNNVVKIQHSEFLASSLFPLNTNYTNLDSALCKLGEEFKQLSDFVRSFSVKDSLTIDSTFSLNGYFLSADVVNNSLGTIKLGQDIPQTTKVFLTAAKVSSLIDTNIVNVKIENALRWNGTKWVNSPLTNEIGARRLYELLDTNIDNNLLDKQVLKYSSTQDRWINSQETGLSGVPDGDYEDIYVTTNNLYENGQFWRIEPEAVSDFELKANSVRTSAISAEQVSNFKFAPNTIQLDRCAFTVGQINTGKNIGNQVPICLETNINKAIPFKTLRGVNCTVESYNNELVIRHNPWTPFPGWAAPRPPRIDPYPSNVFYPFSLRPVGANLGNGRGIFSSIVYTSNNPTIPTYDYTFKTFKVAFPDRLNLVENNAQTEVTVTCNPPFIACTIFGHKVDGTLIQDSDILTRLNLLFDPVSTSIPVGTTCNVIVETISLGTLSNFTTTIPLTLQYYYNRKVVPGTIINFGRGTPGRVDTKIDFALPDATRPTTTSTSWSGSTVLYGTGSINYPSIAITRNIKRYIKSASNTWLLQI